MLAADLTDEDIGRMLWVQAPGNGGWLRILYEGTQRSAVGDERRNGGNPYWIILRASPTPGIMYFHTNTGPIHGVLVRSNTEVYPVEVDYAVGADGSIIELGERPA